MLKNYFTILYKDQPWQELAILQFKREKLITEIPNSYLENFLAVDIHTIDQFLYKKLFMEVNSWSENRYVPLSEPNPDDGLTMWYAFKGQETSFSDSTLIYILEAAEKTLEIYLTPEFDQIPDCELWLTFDGKSKLIGYYLNKEFVLHPVIHQFWEVIKKLTKGGDDDLNSTPV